MIHRYSRRYFKKDLEKDAQKNRLDNLLLHTSTLLGIILVLSQTMINPKFLIKSFVPLFLFIWLIPVYIGYIKGAIVYDLISERLRGWIYLLEGTPVYFIFLGVFFLRTKQNIKMSTIDNYIVVFFLILVIFFGIYVYKKFTKFFDTEISLVEKHIIKRTIVIPVYLGFASLIYLILVDVEINTIEQIINDIGFFVGIGLILVLVLFAFYVERGNKKIIKKLGNHPKLIEKKPITIDTIILGIAFLVSIIVLVLSFYVLKNSNLMVISLFAILLIIYILLHRLLFDNKTVVFD